ncbi:alpha-amylase family glycosyl hydrolase [Candidatus Xianfuyuplasma coldseepsis]|nr:alpha-amylase family glycosyl hydrolase [Xianfuyuplasma coldseepsis]
MATLKLEKLLQALQQTTDTTIYNYTVPDVWNCFDYNPDKLIEAPHNELMVDPYDFYASVIADYILPNKEDDKDYTNAISFGLKRPKRNYSGGDWIKESVVYSTMIRTSAAWDHDRSGKLDLYNIYHMPETGTFVKMLALLPLLQKMGVNVVYMLPISKFSLKDKKGDLGSPYGVSNFDKLDPNLKDPLVGDALTLEEEFQAFVEACHILDMRVMIDIIPRTNSVDSELIREHPEWFYWIKASEYDQYKVPHVPELGETAIPDVENLEIAYQSPDVLRHINMFQYNPKAQDESLWNKVKKSKNLAKAIEQHFDLRVAPAFSDYINDPQPPWTDVTFFRLFLDIPTETRPFVDTTDRPPYILFDTIKANMYFGDQPNMELWQKLADIVPSYQRRFGIDGARIDMGHALPKPLLDMIINKARDIDPDFCFIAEELQPKLAQKAKDNGYNMIIGNGFVMEPRVWEGKLQEFMYDSIELPLPTFACGETHDTPRLAARDGGESLAKLLTVLNMFMPNGVPFINSGQEVYETQPMNTGLDARPNELYMLDPSDPYYKKLALFDLYQFHYTNPRRWELPNILEALKPIRKKFKKQLLDKHSFMPLYAHYDNQNFIGFSYFKTTKSNKENMLFVLGNADTWHEHYIRIDIRLLRHTTNNHEMTGKLLFSTHEAPRPFTQFIDNNTLDIHLGPGEVKIVEL